MVLRNTLARLHFLDISKEKSSLPVFIAKRVSRPRDLTMPTAMAVLQVPGYHAMRTVCQHKPWTAPSTSKSQVYVRFFILSSAIRDLRFSFS